MLHSELVSVLHYCDQIVIDTELHPLPGMTVELEREIARVREHVEGEINEKYARGCSWEQACVHILRRTDLQAIDCILADSMLEKVSKSRLALSCLRMQLDVLRNKQGLAVSTDEPVGYSTFQR